jgi:hypothetical protein
MLASVPIVPYQEERDMFGPPDRAPIVPADHFSFDVWSISIIFVDKPRDDGPDGDHDGDDDEGVEDADADEFVAHERGHG